MTKPFGIIGTYLSRAIIFLGLFMLVSAVHGWMDHQVTKTNVLAHMNENYHANDLVLIKRGPYAGCGGMIMARSDLEYIMYIPECKGQDALHALVHAKDFDDNALIFVEKF